MRTLALVVLGGAAALGVGLSWGCAPPQRDFSSGSGGGGGESSSSHGSAATSGSGGAGATGSTGTTGSTGSTGSTGAGAGDAGVEDCTNGVDDDGDGLVDCEDPDCTGAGYACAADAPAGWSGPAVLYTGAGMPPGCDTDWLKLYASGGLDVVAQGATCAACGCGAPVGQVCGNSAQVTLYSDLNCTAPGPTQVENFGQCFSVSGFTAKSAMAGKVLASGGTCAASGGTPNVPAAAFGTQASICAEPASKGAGCAAGACVPAAPPGYGKSLCIYQDGDVACPAGPFTQKTIVYGSFTDTRGCTACACGAPAGGTCNEQVEVFSNILPGAGCSFSSQAFPANIGCLHPGNPYVTGVLLQPGTAPTGAVCAVSGGKATGAATPAQPTTVCCD